MKKKPTGILAPLALVLSLISLVLSGYLLSTQVQDQTHLIDDLYRENRVLREQIDELNDRLDRYMTVTSLEDWTLTASPWADSTGADVTFLATPSDYQQGVTATLVVMLEGRQVASVPCDWDGSVFSATASLNAADGYSYFCILSGPSGTQQLSIMTPDSPEGDIPVYLLSSLGSYCNLMINDWFEQANSLVITAAYAQVQLPRLCPENDLQILSQELVLRLNGEITARIPVSLAPSEVEGSFDLTITDLHMPMPELTDSDLLELYLEITLSDGRHLQAFGISWQLDNGKLTSAVG